jgi:hypothetical protein
MPDIDAKKIEELRATYSGPRGHAMRFMTIDSALYEALPALLDLAERASLPLAGDVEGLCARLEATRDGVPFGWASSDGRSDIWTPKHLINLDGPEAATLIRHLSSRVEEEKRAKEEAERGRDRLRDVIERDRTKTAEIIGGIRAVVGRWSWLGEGRGSYAWDDDRYQDEFRQMLDALKEATDPLRALAADWTDCPQDYQAARIDWKARAETAESRSAELARALEEARRDDETTWLIECGDPPEYYTGHEYPSRYWTRNHAQAIRFARKEDAERLSVSGLIFDDSERRVVEHQWSDPSRRAHTILEAPNG